MVFPVVNVPSATIRELGELRRRTEALVATNAVHEAYGWYSKKGDCWKATFFA
jgi:hypothetical protein